MTEQPEPHNARAAWPVIDGPYKGYRIACAYDDFCVLDQSGARSALLDADRVRYHLCAVDGGYIWSCAAPA